MQTFFLFLLTDLLRTHSHSLKGSGAFHISSPSHPPLYCKSRGIQHVMWGIYCRATCSRSKCRLLTPFSPYFGVICQSRGETRLNTQNHPQCLHPAFCLESQCRRCMSSNVRDQLLCYKFSDRPCRFSIRTSGLLL